MSFGRAYEQGRKNDSNSSGTISPALRLLATAEFPYAYVLLRFARQIEFQ